MTSFLQKLRVVTAGAAHDLLDKVIDLNSPSAVRQYVRDLEDAIQRIKAEVANADGQVRGDRRVIGDLQHQITSEKDAIARILAGSAATKDSVARAKGSQVLAWGKELQARQDALPVHEKTLADLEAALTQIEAKHTDMVSKVRELERMDRESKAFEKTANAIEQAQQLTATGAGISVDSISEKMNHRHDVASAKFDRAVGSMADASGGQDDAQLDELLDSLRVGTAAAAKG